MPYKNPEQKRINDALYKKENTEKIKQQQKDYRERNREKLVEQDRQKYIRTRDDRLKSGIVERTENTEKYMLKNAQSRAKQKGFDFNLTIEDIVIPDVCPVLGIPLVKHFGKGVNRAQPDSPSLDRIDSSKGYVKGNVRVISWRANDLKRNATIEEVRKIIEYMKREASHTLQE